MEIVVAGLACVGTVLGSLFGVLASNKLVVYRLEQLERKVSVHNNLVERMTIVERDLAATDRNIEGIRRQLEREAV
jgi:hypothetical protein